MIKSRTQLQILICTCSICYSSFICLILNLNQGLANKVYLFNMKFKKNTEQTSLQSFLFVWIIFKKRRTNSLNRTKQKMVWFVVYDNPQFFYVYHRLSRSLFYHYTTVLAGDMRAYFYHRTLRSLLYHSNNWWYYSLLLS